MSTEVIIAILGIFSSFLSGWISWFFTRKKYNSEVDNNLINNMKDSLEFYKALSTDNKERLEEVLKRNELLEDEVAELRKQVFEVMMKICLNFECNMRIRSSQIFNNETSK